MRTSSSKFNEFCNKVAQYVDKRFNIRKIGNDELTLSLTDDLGSKVILFLHWKKVVSPFGFLQLFEAKKNGMTVPKGKFDV